MDRQAVRAQWYNSSQRGDSMLLSLAAVRLAASDPEGATSGVGRGAMASIDELPSWELDHGQSDKAAGSGQRLQLCVEGFVETDWLVRRKRQIRRRSSLDPSALPAPPPSRRCWPCGATRPRRPCRTLPRPGG